LRKRKRLNGALPLLAAARYGCSRTLSALGRGRPMCSAADLTDAEIACEASVLPDGFVVIVKSPWSCFEKLTVTCVVACGVIGPVEASAPPLARWIVSAWVFAEPFVTVKITGPAPTEFGDTSTRWFEMYTVRSTGVGGRGRLANVLPPPHPASDAALTAMIPIVVLRMLR
jgi:hypothetical protein